MTSRFRGTNVPSVPPTFPLASPVKAVEPKITGNYFVGQALTIDPGSWAGFPPPALTYQWTRDGVAIAGQTGTSYTPVTGDADTRIGAVVTATNLVGAVSYTLAGRHARISGGGALLPSTLAPSISWTKDGSVGQTYTVDPGGTGTISYQWYWVGGADISGATAASYVTQTTDTGKILGCRAQKAGEMSASASVIQWVLQAIIKLDSCDATTGWTFSGEALTIDTSAPLEGTGALVIKDTGSAQRAVKLVGSYDVATWGHVGVLMDTGINPDYSNAGAPQIFISNSTSISGSFGLAANDQGAIQFMEPGRKYDHAAVSENANVAGLATGNKYIATGTGRTPYGTTNKLHAVVAKCGGIPTQLITYDDGFLSQYTNAYPALKARGLKASIMTPWDNIGVDGNRILGRMLHTELQEMYNDGTMAMCLDGVGNDNYMTDQANPAACVTELNRGRAWLQTYSMIGGKGGDGRDAYCYPNGYVANQAYYASMQIVAAVTSTAGSAVVNFGVAPTTALTVGQRVAGYGVPDGTTISVVNSATQVTLSNTISAARTVPMRFAPQVNFYPNDLQLTLRAAGFKFGRTTVGGTVPTRFGAYDRDLMFNGNTTTGQTSAQMIAVTDLAITRGASSCVYIHNHDDTRDLAWMDYMQAKVAAGLLQVLTIPELIRRDYGNSMP